MILKARRQKNALSKAYICLNININMSKTLTIRDEVYNKLVNVKKGGESFSELFLELIEKKRFTGEDLKEYMGILSEEEYKEMKKKTKYIRKKVSEDLAKRGKRWKALS